MMQPFAGGQLAVNKTLNASEVPHVSDHDVRRLIEAVDGRNVERDRLLIAMIYDAALRVSEALGVRPIDLNPDGGGWLVNVTRKGGKQAGVAISASLVARLGHYAQQHGISQYDRIFPLSRKRVFQICQAAFESAGIVKPDHVGHVHVLRHSGALNRLAKTGNPRTVQAQLGHASIGMTMRYMTTLQFREAIQVQQEVDNGW